MDNTQERIVKTKKEINKKKSRISTLIFTIGIVMILSTLLGVGVGLIMGKLAKVVAVSLATGMLISIDPIIKINNIAEDIKVDERVLITLNRKNNYHNNNVTNLSYAKEKDDSIVSNNTKNKELTDEDIDKMTEIFKKKTYNFNHNNNSFHQEYDQDIENQHKSR